MNKPFNFASLLFAGATLFTPFVANAKTTPKQSNTQQNTSTQAQYYKLTKKIKAQDVAVIIKDKKLVITNKVKQTKFIKKGTGLYARQLNNTTWQVYNAQYPSNKKGVWIINTNTNSIFKKAKTPVVQQKQNFKAEPSQYQVATNEIQPNNNTYTDLYAPTGFKPVQFSDTFTMNPGQKVSVKSDDANNRYIIQAGGQLYALQKNDNLKFSNINVTIQGNNVVSMFAPTDSEAVAPQGFKPIGNQTWIQLNSDGSIKQYYFYSNSNSKNTGWVKATIQTQNGKSVIVPENNK